MLSEWTAALGKFVGPCMWDIAREWQLGLVKLGIYLKVNEGDFLKSLIGPSKMKKCLLAKCSNRATTPAPSQGMSAYQKEDCTKRTS